MNTKLTKWLLTACMAGPLLAITPGAKGDSAIWHCSKYPQLPTGDVSSIINDDNHLFYLSSFSSTNIDITLNDLSDVYSGRRVTLGRELLTACFWSGDTSLNRNAFETIGLNWSVLQLMSRRSSISLGNLRMVQSEAEMMACIANNFPAVGYFNNTIENEDIAPCF